ncbi:hypothetical protein [Rhizobium oryzicola]|uniref:CopG family transcriptional regulator n=1 Tax=Rhizobium oryzicola TaxID=1232668 RepID=A0ABT8SVG6_9HYPH|nr:hypothetical protein [Rhizobium oryzicola]MDO1582402.1 hypothetical protein [Rhizobium oryzicola]
MEAPSPITLALTDTERSRLNRIAAEMGRTPSDLASAIVSQWALTVFKHLDGRKARPTGPNFPDFINSGVVAPPAEEA